MNAANGRFTAVGRAAVVVIAVEGISFAVKTRGAGVSESTNTVVVTGTLKACPRARSRGVVADVHRAGVVVVADVSCAHTAGIVDQRVHTAC